MIKPSVDMSSPVFSAPKFEGKLNIVFRKCDEGGFIAECLEIPGCMSQGETMEETKANIEDAINGCLSVMLEDSIANAVRGRESWNVVGIDRQETLSVVPPHLLTPAGA